MNSRLDNAAKVVGDLREKVGQIHEVGKAAAELVNIMRAPKLRGGMGEFFNPAKAQQAISEGLEQTAALYKNAFL